MSSYSIHKECSTFILAFRVFGIGPPSQRRWPDLLLKAYSIFLATITLLISYICLFNDDPADSESFETSLNFFHKFCVLCAYLATIINAIYHRHSQAEIIDVCSRIDRKLRIECKAQLNYQRCNRNALTYFTLSFGGITLIQLYFVRHFMNEGRHTVFFKYCYFAMVMERIQIAQVEFYVHLLNYRLSIVKANLKRIAQTYKDNYHIGHHRRIGRGAIASSSNMQQLLILKSIYSDLYAMSRAINATFGIALLFVIGQYFAQITSEAYGIFITMAHGNMHTILFRWFICQVLTDIMVLASISLSCSNSTQMVGGLQHINC